MRLVASLIVVALACNLRVAIAAEDNLELELLQVLFRHGDRAPDKKEIYENDPYEPIYRQIGYGQLTKLGKQRLYKLGQVLRQRYDGFLGEYAANDVYARSTDLDRTKVSLQLALAGLYPPGDGTRWSDAIPWAPIPTHYLPQEIDFLSFIKCYKYVGLLGGQLRQVRRNATSDEDFINSLKTKVQGDLPKNSMLGLYMNLKIALLLNLPLPSWCSESDYDRMEKIAEAYYSTLTSTRLMSQIAAGATIEQFLKNVEGEAGARKIYLYSTHDLNVAAFTNAHNFTGIPRIPDFGSAVVVEKLRGSDNRVYLRMFLWTGVTEQWIPLKLEDCDCACPLLEYERLVQPILPDEASRQCNTLNAFCEDTKCSGEA